MKIIKENQNFELRTQLKDITIQEFNQIVNIMSDDKQLYFENWLDLLTVLGMPEDMLNELTIPDLLEIVKEFNLFEPQENLEILQDIELDGYTYRLFEDKFKLTVRVSSIVEQTIKSHPKDFIPWVIANLYKRTDLTDLEHKQSEHIKHKAKLFSQLTMDKCIVLFTILFEGIITKMQKFNG